MFWVYGEISCLVCCLVFFILFAEWEDGSFFHLSDGTAYGTLWLVTAEREWERPAQFSCSALLVLCYVVGLSVLWRISNVILFF